MMTVGRRLGFFAGIWLAAAVLTGGCERTRQNVARDDPSVSPSDCAAPDPALQGRLPAEWTPFLPAVRTCSVRATDGTAVLRLVSVWADIYYQASDSSLQVEMPRPLLLTASGDPVGRLPFNFPDDPPRELTVTFRDWKDGFPRRIDLFVKDPAVLGDRELPPLHWDGAGRQFVPLR